MPIFEGSIHLSSPSNPDWNTPGQPESNIKPIIVCIPLFKLSISMLIGWSKKKTGAVVTAQDIAVKHDIRVSIAKRILTDLEEKNILNEAFSNRRLKVYVKT